MKRTNAINYDALWDKVSNFAKRVGRVSARPVLLLYYVLMSDKTPKADKMLIIATLSYIVLPIDILDAKRIPVIGWLDEIASLAVTYDKVCKNITPEMEEKVDAILDKWFPEYTQYSPQTQG